MINKDDEIFELKVKLQIACQTINDQLRSILKFQEDFSALMSPEHKENLWKETTERLQQLELELSLAKKSEEKAAEYNRFLIEKLIKMSRQT